MPESQAEALASRLKGWTGLQGVVSSHLPDKAPEQVSIFRPPCLCSFNNILVLHAIQVCFLVEQHIPGVHHCRGC